MVNHSHYPPPPRIPPPPPSLSSLCKTEASFIKARHRKSEEIKRKETHPRVGRVPKGGNASSHTFVRILSKGKMGAC